MIEFGRNILIVAAHPDDEILGVGGTIPLIKKTGAVVDVVVVTDGSTVQYKEDKEILFRKYDEAKRAAEMVGVDNLFQWEFPDMSLDTVAHSQLNCAFEKIFTERNYDCVFVQNGSDINLDHRLIYHSVMVAARPYPHQAIRKILSYYVNSSTEWGGIYEGTPFNPNVYVDISETIDMKVSAMEAYESEIRNYPHPRSSIGIRNSAAYFGNQVGYQFAEPFKLILAR